MPRTIRILTTNDFFACFAPVPTSTGALPGGEGVKRTVAALRQGQPTLWADTGDFSHSGPLSRLAQGADCYAAAAALGIDVASVGNHDFDFGIERLRAALAVLGFPLLGANLAGFVPHVLLPTSEGPIGFVGLTHPECETMRPYSAFPTRDLPVADRSLETIVRDAAAKL